MGSLQRTSGRVNATIQVVSSVSKVTTSFNLIGLMNAGGILEGSFSGCEISKAAGTVAGSFKMMVREAPLVGWVGWARAATCLACAPARQLLPRSPPIPQRAASEDDAEPEEEEAPPPKPVKRSSKKKVVAESSSEEEVVVKKSSKKKSAAAESEESEEEAPKKSKGKGKKAASSSEVEERPVSSKSKARAKAAAAAGSDSD